MRAARKIERLCIDLTGARLEPETCVSPRPGAAVSGDEIRAAQPSRLEPLPLYLEALPVRLRLTVRAAAFACAPAEGGKSMLALQRAADGRLEIEISRVALEQFLHSLAVEAGAKQGADIKETHLELISRGPRSLSFRAEVTAKMFIMKAAVTLSGDLEVDDTLALRVSKLALGGNAMATGIIGKFARPYFDRLQSEPISLAALSLGDVKLRDVELASGETLRLQALRFGS